MVKKCIKNSEKLILDKREGSAMSKRETWVFCRWKPNLGLKRQADIVAVWPFFIVLWVDEK